MKKILTNLSFDELEREMEVLDCISTKSVLGGKFPPKSEPIDPDSVYTGSLGGGGGYVSDGKNSGFNSGYTSGGFTGAGNTPSMDHSSSSNPGGDSGGAYLVDNHVYTAVSGDPYYKVSFDGGKSWIDQASSFVGFNLEKFNENLGNYATLASLGAFAANNPQAEAAFGKVGTFTSAFGIGIDTYKLYDYYNNNQGDMDGFRFSIRTTGGVATILGGSMLAGPPGIVFGVIAAGSTMIIEAEYDDIAKKLNQMMGSFANQYGAGGFPQAH
jgi:hypothetical protein